MLTHREIRRSFLTIFTIWRPLKCARRRRRASTAGIAALPLTLGPMASTMQAIEEAVPMVMHVPADRFTLHANASSSSALTLPARYSVNTL
jgi:hypothetical protein